jgi:ubiquinone/menaquinone biosynthesis C-methylase UbiE
MTAEFSRANFAAVDDGDARVLVDMMDATDAWPAVQAVRAWILERTGVGDGDLVVDVGCGPGTFGSLVVATGGTELDVDASATMLATSRARNPAALRVRGVAEGLPVREGFAHLVHAERILQWTDDPFVALRALHRVVRRGGWLAVTDTDWATLEVSCADAHARERFARAALRWVPHARVAAQLADVLSELTVHDVESRTDVVEIDAWDPDDPSQRDGPPGLPLHSIGSAASTAADRAAVATDLARLAVDARAGRFAASVTLVSVLARV